MNDALLFILLAIFFVGIIVVVVNIKKKSAFKKLISKLEGRWGKNPLLFESKTEKFKMRSNVSGYFNNIKDSIGESGVIDDITWADLEMDSVFQRLNNTLSTVGEQYFYYLLRKPVTECQSLIERNRVIEFFQNNQKSRLCIQVLLAKLDKLENTDITNYFLNGFRNSNYKGTYYKLLAAGFAISPFLMLLNLPLGLFTTIGFFIINMTVHNNKTYEIESHLEAFNYIINLIDCADKISNLQINEINLYCKNLKSSLKNLKGIVSRSFLVLYRSQDPFLEYIKVIFLGELIAYEGMFKLILKYRNNLLEIFEIVGLMDSLISIASYRESIQYYSIPELYDYTQSKKLNITLISSNPQIDFEDIYHPLLKEPVSNSLHIDKSTLVTGSNASGKSTFLKTVAINAIFAQTIYTCLAKKYISNYFRILTSMAVKDDLLSGESYYIVEIKSVKRIIDSINENIPCLFIIDEVLRGTNTIERIAASSEILNYLSRNNCLTIAATHDLELAYILKNQFDNYHFQEYITDSDIIFDYKIHPGISRTRNAIKLLKIMGYKDTIVESAEARAKYFIENGKWEQIK